MGGVTVDGSMAEYFGLAIPQSWAQTLRSRPEKYQQAEIYLRLLALLRWAPALAHRDVALGVDNDSARMAVVRGDSAKGPSAAILDSCYRARGRIEGLRLVRTSPPTWSNVRGSSQQVF